MYEETVEKIARMMARDNDDEQHWGVYATRAMQIIGTCAEVYGFDEGSFFFVSEEGAVSITLSRA